MGCSNNKPRVIAGLDQYAIDEKDEKSYDIEEMKIERKEEIYTEFLKLCDDEMEFIDEKHLKLLFQRVTKLLLLGRKNEGITIHHKRLEKIQKLLTKLTYSKEKKNQNIIRHKISFPVFYEWLLNYIDSEDESAINILARPPTPISIKKGLKEEGEVEGSDLEELLNEWKPKVKQVIQYNSDGNEIKQNDTALSGNVNKNKSNDKSNNKLSEIKEEVIIKKEIPNIERNNNTKTFSASFLLGNIPLQN